MTVFAGKYQGEGLKIAIVKANFNELITSKLHEGAVNTLIRHGVEEEDIDTVVVPGAFEIPFAVRKVLNTERYDGVITLGAVIRGETPHFDYVCQAATSGVASLNLESSVPIIFGVLTTDTSEQALARTGIKHGNSGSESARAVLEMATLSLSEEVRQQV